MTALFDEFTSEHDIAMAEGESAWEAQKRMLEEANLDRDRERAEMFRKLTGLIDLLGHEIADPTRRTIACYEALDLVYELERWV